MSYISDDELDYIAKYGTPTTKPPETPKKTFWETGFGQGLDSLWKWTTSNPDQVVALVAPKRVIDPTSANYKPETLDNGGNISGQVPNQPPQQNNNSTLLIIMGVAVVVILFLLFKKE